jgi:hypothetical protein
MRNALLYAVALVACWLAGAECAPPPKQTDDSTRRYALAAHRDPCRAHRPPTETQFAINHGPVVARAGHVEIE